MKTNCATYMETLYRNNKAKLDGFFKSGMIYCVTEESLSPGKKSEQIVEQALLGGVRMIQLRDKNLSTKERLAKARRVRELTHEFGALFFIDDNVDIAFMVSADGVHLGQDDLPLAEVRKDFPYLLLGQSSHDVDEAQRAIADNADYLNIGPIFPTSTKAWDKSFLGLEGLKNIASNVTIPFTVMGGIKQENIPALVQHGARICAMVTEISLAEDMAQKSKDLLALIQGKV